MRYLSALILASVGLFAACARSAPPADIAPMIDVPNKVLWAWERPEDLRFIDPKEFGVAFLAQTISLEKDGVFPKRRRQPLDVPSGTYLIAVTRIEATKGTFERPTFSTEMRDKTVSLIKSTIDLPNVRAVQIDFDATVSERGFYRWVMSDLRKQMPENTPITMTALASWCAGDTWLTDMPVAEIVPMVFQMGADTEKIKNFLKNGNDWNEPLCRSSYGISVDEGNFDGIRPGRRMYFFSNAPWTKASVPKAR